ncbi:hypothetical protein BBJ29_008194 [Phytophthora kernoviae]|uniref:Uncharacterized protein n=1 Tax=Phytophthora kernoviae TaxID=325452 RepID=A0A3F2RDM0_9STRA|nr:hypothetical protein BBP00_00009076 [Phytophthora kernoviae]RLN70817.1 hypothetical protein BBJ29_008194 [Phytophthora kernoviae]
MTSSSIGLQVWAVEGVAHAILFFMDVFTLDATLHVIQEASALHGYLQDSSLWKELLHLHFSGERDSELRYLALPARDRGWDWTLRERMCIELQEFLLSADEKTYFDKTVSIIKGDIGYVNDIDGKPLDGIAFPTNSHLTNHYVGAAQAVFRRAGRGLTDHVLLKLCTCVFTRCLGPNYG